MKNFQKEFIKIYQTERGIMLLMSLNLILSIALIIFSIINLNPNASVVKVGYGDIGGYRDGVWTDMLIFPLLAVLFGIFHNFLALRIFHKRGGGMTKFFLLTTSALIFGAFFVIVRLLEEG